MVALTVLLYVTYFTFTFTFIHLADTFIQSDLQMRIEAVKLTV